MSQLLINHNPDLLQLREEGFDIQIIGGQFLIVNSIPYVNEKRETKRGILVSQLNVVSNKVTIKDHTVHFIGEKPCYSDGIVITGIINNSRKKKLHPSLEVDHYFSNKPKGGNIFSNYYEKMLHYISIIYPPAAQIDPTLDPRTFHVNEDIDDNSCFVYPDTNAGRAEFFMETEIFKNLRIGIVGIGGTGSYVLDFVSKTPVMEIHIFDGDRFNSHNAYRAPGAASIEEINYNENKATFFRDKYKAMHKGVVSHSEYISEDNLQSLDGLDFVFICIDKSKPKSFIIPHLKSKNIHFVDVGLGLQVTDDRKVFGDIRTTSYKGGEGLHIEKHVSLVDHEEDIYSSNIQIAELNALNAALAVINWKKSLNFYLDQTKEVHSVFNLRDNKIINESN